MTRIDAHPGLQAVVLAMPTLKLAWLRIWPGPALGSLQSKKGRNRKTDLPGCRAILTSKTFWAPQLGQSSLPSGRTLHGGLNY